MSIDDRRHRAVFDARMFNPTPVHIIGCGGPGSHIAARFARYGVDHIHVWDPDIVDRHNIPNQHYGVCDVGKRKVLALQDWARRTLRRSPIVPHVHAVHSSVPLSGVVFVATDSMTSRKCIVDTCLRQVKDIQCCIEVRMDAFYIRIYAFDPNDAAHLALWDHYWYPDEVAENETAGCGAPISMGDTAAIAGELCVRLFVHWWRALRGEEQSAPPNELILDLRSYTLRTEYW